ncbi:MAG TPA: FecR domain-containing protein [Myxococcota bacterium]|nr:FecR domain-containing protein [Myxococcota bacterium]
MRPIFLLLALLSWLAGPPSAAADDPAPSGAQRVGKVLATEGSVSATLGADTRTVVRGEAVYRGDWLETDPRARAKVLLDDETELVVGPASRIHIDEFVYSGSGDQGKVLIEMGVGLLRFTSGNLKSESYEVKTPVASIGVRGTIFDTIVAAVSFATTVILRDGAIWIKTFGGEKTVSKKDHASTAASSGDEPSDPMEATDEQDDATDPLKKPFQEELQRSQRPNVPINVQKPRMDPNSNRPSGRPNMNRY